MALWVTGGIFNSYALSRVVGIQNDCLYPQVHAIFSPHESDCLTLFGVVLWSTDQQQVVSPKRAGGKLVYGWYSSLEKMLMKGSIQVLWVVEAFINL